jgi:hypothetical protein
VSSQQVIGPTSYSGHDSVTSRYGHLNFTEIPCVRYFINAFSSLPFTASGNLY